MKVLGVDPGSISTGYGIVESGNHGMTALGWGTISSGAAKSFPLRLKSIYEGLIAIIEKYRPTACAIEDLFSSKNPRSALKLGQAKGAAMLAAVNSGLDVFEYSPMAVKQAVVGYGRGDKTQTKFMVAAMLNLGDFKATSHASDALAVAICHIHSAALILKLARQGYSHGEKDPAG